MNGGAGTLQGAGGCLDEMRRRELLKERGQSAEQSRAAVSPPTRAPTGVMEGFSLNMWALLLSFKTTDCLCAPMNVTSSLSVKTPHFKSEANKRSDSDR